MFGKGKDAKGFSFEEGREMEEKLVRVLHAREKLRLTPAAEGIIYKAVQMGLLSEKDRETLLEQIMFLSPSKFEEIDVEELRFIMEDFIEDED
ncbi:MAG: DUF494 family protein, partial [Clostridia bacterium]|nr:DUF494 family protein [Clostridia bacterium]